MHAQHFGVPAGYRKDEINSVLKGRSEGVGQQKRAQAKPADFIDKSGHLGIAVPENTLKFGVGVMLSAFGVFWTGEGLGI